MMVVAVLDACVLYSAVLRDLLMLLTVQTVFQPKWTETIHDEWISSLLNNRPDLTRDRLERTRQLMNRHSGDWKCRGYELLVSTLVLPDEKDCHVLAAAIAGNASCIVTYNLSDFPESVLSKYDIIAQHPDVFLTNLLVQEPEAFFQAVRELLASLKNPPRTFEEQLEIMSEQGLEETARQLAGQWVATP